MPLDLALELPDPGRRLLLLLGVLRAHLMELLLEHVARDDRLRQLLGAPLERFVRGLELGLELGRTTGLALRHLLQPLGQLAAILF